MIVDSTQTHDPTPGFPPLHATVSTSEPYPHSQPHPPNQVTSAIERWIGNHPVLCVGVAMTFGVAIGCLIKRR